MSGHWGGEYKIPMMIDSDLIHSRKSVVKRPIKTPQRKLTKENCEYLKKIGLILKKKKC